MDTITSTGGSALVSYNLEWDSGLGTSVFTELQGYTTATLT